MILFIKCWLITLGIMKATELVANAYIWIEGEIKRLKDLLTPTCNNCVWGCALRHGRGHCEKHVRDGSEVSLVANIKYLKEFINGKKV